MSPTASSVARGDAAASTASLPVLQEVARKPSYRIAAIGGDGIGPEVIGAAVEVLKAMCEGSSSDSSERLQLDFTDFDWSSERYKREGAYLPSDALDTLKTFDAILFGSVGAVDVPDHVSLWGLRLAICQPLQMYANVRPTRIIPGVRSPLRDVDVGDLDWVIVRQNTENEYAGHGGRSHIGFAHEVATEVSIFTRTAVRQIMQFAFETARARPRRRLCVVTKSNAQRNGMVMWDEIAAEVGREFPDVHVDKMLVDAMTVRMTMDPRSLDTIVATNLHADILSDLAAALSGSIGIAPTANLDPTRAHPSMFEPIHGSAFDIAGKGVANPIGACWSAAMMLEWLGEKGHSERLMRAIHDVCARGITTADLGGTCGTAEVTNALIAHVRGKGAPT